MALQLLAQHDVELSRCNVLIARVVAVLCAAALDKWLRAVSHRPQCGRHSTLGDRPPTRSSSSAAEQIRFAEDRELFDKLPLEPNVKNVNEALVCRQEEGPPGTRPQVVSDISTLEQGDAPSLHKMADLWGAQLGLDIPLELYVFVSPQFNAARV